MQWSSQRPDHLHAVIAKAAMDLGKHVYVQKPLTATVHEARVLRQIRARPPQACDTDGQSGAFERRCAPH